MIVTDSCSQKCSQKFVQLEGENSNSMKVHYDAESDILMFILLDQPPSNAIAESDGIIVSYNANK